MSRVTCFVHGEFLGPALEGAAQGRYHPPMLTPLAGEGRPLVQQGLRLSLPGWSAEAVAALFAIVLYLPSLGFSFVFDDHALINAGGIPLALGGYLPYRPVRYASYWIDAAMGGSPLVYHAHNVLLFALLIALVVRLARRLGAAPIAALVAALLVAAHPLAVEAAAYVSGRRDLLGAAFGLGAILTWIDGRRAAALALLLLGVGSKESALLAAPAMMLASVCGVAAPRSGDRPLLAAGAGSAFGLMLLYGAVGPWTPTPEWAGLALPGRVLAHYGDHLLRPLLFLGAGLSAEYPDLGRFVERVRGGDLAGTPRAMLFELVTLTIAAAVVATGALALRRSRSAARQRLLPPLEGALAGAIKDASAQASSWSFVAAWAALGIAALAIWGGLHEPGADRHALIVLPAAGVAAALALGRLSGTGRAAAFVLSGVALLALVTATRQQMQVWRSDRALWAHTVAAQPGAVRAQLNLAGVLAADGRYDEAAHHLDRALRRKPDFVAAYLGRAVVRCAQRKPVAARRDLRRALASGAESASVERIGRDCPLPEFVVSLSEAVPVAPTGITNGQGART